MGHGYFEILQGNAPTGGLIINAIGEQHRMWPHGSEPAFTLLPTFLVSGMAAIWVSLAIVIWSVGFIHTQHGATVFLLLFVLLSLVGGGIGHMFLFAPGWAFATRINQPLTWWRKVLPEGGRGVLAALWPWLTAAGSLLYLLALEIAVFGYFPGAHDADRVVTIMLIALGVGLGCYVLAFVAAITRDIAHQTD
jgi:hypothetical protein